MYILSNFSSPYCFISFIIGAMFMFVAICIAAMGKVQEPMNKVHFYMARDKDGNLFLYLKKPIRMKTTFISYYRGGTFINVAKNFSDYGLNPDYFKDLKWEDEPVEVFINMED